MRDMATALAVSLFLTQFAFSLEMTEEQKEVWDTLEEQVALDMKKDFEAEKKFIHPKACLWGDRLPAPISPSPKAYSYFEKWWKSQDDIAAHYMVPVSVVVVDDVAIINFYLHMMAENDDGKAKEIVIRGHNTWKKEDDRWLLLSTYNTWLPSEEDDD
jgi:ketosteroid isomerase-like protein